MVYQSKIRNGESYSTNNGVVVKGKNGSKDIISNEPSVDIGNNFKNNQWFKKDNAKLVTEVGKTYLEWSSYTMLMENNLLKETR